MASPADLLERFKPHLIYDSQEGYFADSAAEWTDAPGNVLQRADKTVIAAASPRGRQAKLSLDFLGGDTYANGVPVERGHQISHPKKNYLEVYRELHPQERYRNRVYCHAVKGKEQLSTRSTRRQASGSGRMSRRPAPAKRLWCTSRAAPTPRTSGRVAWASTVPTAVCPLHRLR